MTILLSYIKINEMNTIMPLVTTNYQEISMSDFKKIIIKLINNPFQIGESYEQVIDTFTKMACTNSRQNVLDNNQDPFQRILFFRVNYSYHNPSYSTSLYGSVSLSKKLNETINQITSSTVITKASGVIIYTKSPNKMLIAQSPIYKYSNSYINNKNTENYMIEEIMPTVYQLMEDSFLINLLRTSKNKNINNLKSEYPKIFDNVQKILNQTTAPNATFNLFLTLTEIKSIISNPANHFEII